MPPRPRPPTLAPQIAALAREGWRVSDIAAALACSPANVSMTLAREGIPAPPRTAPGPDWHALDLGSDGQAYYRAAALGGLPRPLALLRARERYPAT